MVPQAMAQEETDLDDAELAEASRARRALFVSKAFLGVPILFVKAFLKGFLSFLKGRFSGTMIGDYPF